jgi:hypothetical protein
MLFDSSYISFMSIPSRFTSLVFQSSSINTHSVFQSWISHEYEKSFQSLFVQLIVIVPHSAQSLRSQFTLYEDSSQLLFVEL